MLKSKEHYDLIEQFEKEFSHRHLAKEPKERWAKGNVFQDGQTNELFLAYRTGYAYGKVAI